MKKRTSKSRKPDTKHRTVQLLAAFRKASDSSGLDMGEQFKVIFSLALATGRELGVSREHTRKLVDLAYAHMELL